MFDKNKNFLAGIYRCTRFLKLNNISIPDFRDVSGNVLRGGPTDYGYYRPPFAPFHALESPLKYYQRTRGIVSVNVRKTKLATKVPGFCWSYPGYKADRTASGVCAHETGHHLQYILKIRKPIMKGPVITSYEPTCNEAFAETARLFITNPDLLRVGRPLRWEYFVKELKLKHLELVPWRLVLKGAHPRFFEVAEKWITK